MNTILNQSDLDRCARYVDAAIDGMLHAQHLREEGATFSAQEAEAAAGESAQQALRLLIARGAQVEGRPAPADVPLELLDTPNMRRLRDGLRYALDAAEAVDRERGHVLKGGQACGWSDAVGDVYERVRQEVEGPRGRE